MMFPGVPAVSGASAGAKAAQSPISSVSGFRSVTIAGAPLLPAPSTYGPGTGFDATQRILG